ncbi:FecR domain-containing protein [Thiolapillus sp.]
MPGKGSSRFHGGRIGFVLVLLFCGQMAFAAETQEEWLYSFQPGDNLWNLTERFLIDQSYWTRLVKLNQVKRPRQMPPGSQVRVPLEWLKVEPAEVQVVNVRGAVALLRPEQAEQPLLKNSWLKNGDRLRVGDDASVLLEFSDGTRQLLGSGTEIELVRTNRFSHSGIADTTIRILRGETENQVPTRGTRFEIRTPSANTSVRGTHFRVKVPADRESVSRVETLAGAVNVHSPQGGLVLNAGYGTIVEQDQAPAPAVKLLPAPPIAPLPPVVRHLPLEVSWKPVNGAAGYRVLISEPGDNGVSVLDSRVSHHRFSTSALPDGHYRVRLRAVDTAGLDGAESAVEFELDARPIPPVSVAPPAEATLRSTSVDFEWSTPPQVSGYRFQLAADDEFQSLTIDKKGLSKTRLNLVLQPGTWFWRVASTHDDEQGVWGKVRRLLVKPAPAAPVVEVEADKQSLQLRWREGSAGQRHRLQLSEDAGFSQVLMDKVTNEPAWTVHRSHSPLHFRVRIIDDDGYEGAWSPVQTVYPEPEPWYMFGVPAIAIILLAL